MIIFLTMDLILVCIGVIVSSIGLKLIRHKPKFNYEKTTSGRTRKFLEYAESKKHFRLKLAGKLILPAGLILIVGGVLLFFSSNQ